jgi:hypothetical protein
MRGEDAAGSGDGGETTESRGVVAWLARCRSVSDGCAVDLHVCQSKRYHGQYWLTEQKDRMGKMLPSSCVFILPQSSPSHISFQDPLLHLQTVASESILHWTPHSSNSLLSCSSSSPSTPLSRPQAPETLFLVLFRAVSRYAAVEAWTWKVTFTAVAF